MWKWAEFDLGESEFDVSENEFDLGENELDLGENELNLGENVFDLGREYEPVGGVHGPFKSAISSFSLYTIGLINTDREQQTILGWGFCGIQNNQGRGKDYQLKPKAQRGW